MSYATQAVQPVGDYSGCRSVADIERVLRGLQRRTAPLSWSDGMKLVNHPQADRLNQHPRLAGLAEGLNRVGEVLDALKRIES